LSIVEAGAPLTGYGLDLLAACACYDGCSTLDGIDCIEYDETRIVRPTVGVDEAALEPGSQWLSCDVRSQIDRRRGRQPLTRCEVVVQEQADPNHPRRPQVLIVRHHEVQWPHDVRRGVQEHLALDERFADQAEVKILQVPQAPVDQFRAGRRGVPREVVLFAQQYGQPAPGGVSRDPCSIDSAADDQQVVAVTPGVRFFA
jgi:hypothetical protein